MLLFYPKLKTWYVISSSVESSIRQRSVMVHRGKLGMSTFLGGIHGLFLREYNTLTKSRFVLWADWKPRAFGREPPTSSWDATRVPIDPPPKKRHNTRMTTNTPDTWPLARVVDRVPWNNPIEIPWENRFRSILQRTRIPVFNLSTGLYIVQLAGTPCYAKQTRIPFLPTTPRRFQRRSLT